MRQMAAVLILMIFALQSSLPGAATSQPAPGEPLWPGKAPAALGDKPKDQPTLSIYLPPSEKNTGTAILVCPGGGYSGLAIKHEGYDVAKWLNERGIAAFVLKYRVAPYRHPVPMNDAKRAMRIVRSRCREWKIDPARIGIMGFSAGGHLASTLATHFDDGDPKSADPIERVSCRPDFAVLVYPVISMTSDATHSGSRKNLLGLNPDPALCENLSNEKQVTANTPPTFLTHSRTDKGVKVQNSILFHEALQKNHVPSQLLIMESGGHGWGLAPNDPVISTWPDRCLQWLRELKLLPPTP